jgi:hypothetical protein
MVQYPVLGGGSAHVQGAQPSKISPQLRIGLAKNAESRKEQETGV